MSVPVHYRTRKGIILFCAAAVAEWSVWETRLADPRLTSQQLRSYIVYSDPWNQKLRSSEVECILESFLAIMKITWIPKGAVAPSHNPVEVMTAELLYSSQTPYERVRTVAKLHQTTWLKPETPSAAPAEPTVEDVRVEIGIIRKQVAYILNHIEENDKKARLRLDGSLDSAANPTRQKWRSDLRYTSGTEPLVTHIQKFFEQRRADVPSEAQALCVLACLARQLNLTVAPVNDGDQPMKPFPALITRYSVQSIMTGIEMIIESINDTPAYALKMEDNMTTTPHTITTQTNINGRDAAQYTDEQLYDMIRQHEAEIEKLNGIVHKPKSLTDKITALENGIKSLVAYMDEREPKEA